MTPAYQFTTDFLASRTCGLPPYRRPNWYFAMLTVAVDDSGSDKQGPAFVLAGFVAPVKQWGAFSAVWDAALKSGPKPLEYFKMSEANSRKFQFDGWSVPDRDRKVEEFARIIRDYAMFGVWAVLWWHDFEVLQRQYKDYPQEPYEILFHNIMAMSVHHVKSLPVPEKIDFIFDEQNKEGKQARKVYKITREMLPDEDVAYVPHDPQHMKDTDFLPLQAADLYAWQVRRFLADNVKHGINVTKYQMRPILKMLDVILAVDVNIHQKRLKAFFEELKEAFPKPMP